MKHIVLVLVVLIAAGTGVWAQEGDLRAGVQVGSDGFVGLLLYGGQMELGVKAQLNVVSVDVTEGSETTTVDYSMLVGGLHVGYLAGRPGNPWNLGIGAEGRFGIGLADLEYDAYVRIGPRLAVNFLAHRNILLTGIMYPLWIMVDDQMEQAGTRVFRVDIPRGSVAVTLLF
jgi:hypothetical protein